MSNFLSGGATPERLTPRRDDGVHRQRAFARVPDPENGGDDGREGARGDVHINANTIGDVVGNQRARDADQDDGQPVAGGTYLRSKN